MAVVVCKGRKTLCGKGRQFVEAVEMLVGELLNGGMVVHIYLCIFGFTARFGFGFTILSYYNQIYLDWDWDWKWWRLVMREGGASLVVVASD